MKYLVHNVTTGEYYESDDLRTLWRLVLREREEAEEAGRPLDLYELGCCTYQDGWPAIDKNPLAIFWDGFSGIVTMMNTGIRKVLII